MSSNKKNPRRRVAVREDLRDRVEMRLARARALAQRKPRAPYVVGIGASAGGLEALRQLFGAFTRAPAGMAFVVVQHLAPMHRSRLVELIASATRLPVSEVENGVRPLAGRIYITPPNANIICENGRLRLKRSLAGPKPSIDLFLRTLAADQRARAIGVVLSGTASDGALGVRAIKQAGGITFAQSPESAKYDSMPKSALQGGAVDYAMTPDAIARELMHIDAEGPSPRARPKKRPADADPYERVMRILEGHVGVNFLKYKQSTIRRRLERRLAATRCAGIGEYADYLEQTPAEAQNLLQNILISVTSFYRDSEAFRNLARVVRRRMKGRRDAAVLRCWVIGCATGEEAYSLAILLSEAIEESGRGMRLQIFATDLDEHALTVARRGIYPAQSVAAVPKKLVARYFEPADAGNFQVRQSLRDTIVFARHNATEDAPFLNLDLVSCRNVLIYFTDKLQEELFRSVQYALMKGGLLFLGRSEAVPHESRTFRIVDKRNKIYERLALRGETPQHVRKDVPQEAAMVSRAREVGEALDLFGAVVAGLAPDSIVVDHELFVRHVFGKAGELLVHPPGQATQNLSKLLPGDLGIEVISLVHRAEKTRRAAVGRRHQSAERRRVRTLQMTAVPLEHGARREYLICFQRGVADRPERAGRPLDAGTAGARIRELESELHDAREHLQTVLEEQETASEELQSLNEELQSSNEELQSSNEELETTNEELQSANEELTTVNEELNVKSGELQSMNQRLQAIQSAIVHPLLTVDRSRRLLSFNPAARQLFRLTEADLGADLRAAGTLADVRPLTRLVEQAYQRKTEPRLQLELSGRRFEAQIQLLRGAKGAIDGAVASFVENTDIVRALETADEAREQLSSILEATPAVVTMKDAGGAYRYANRRFCELLRTTAEAIKGRTDEELFGAPAAALLQEHDHEVVRKKRAIEFVETYPLAGENRIWTSAKVPLLDSRRRVHSICTVSLDMTERIAHERQLELFRTAISASNQGILILQAGEPDFRVMFSSTEVARLMGIPEQRLPGMTLGEVLAGLKAKTKGTPPAEQIAAQIRREEDAIVNVEIEAGGDALCLEIRSCHVSLKERERHLILTFHDVTQRMRDQRTIEQQRDELGRVTRFSALTEIAAGIAHEVNTPLGVIVAKADILKALAARSGSAPIGTAELAEDITRMAKNVSEIVHGLANAVSRHADRREEALLQQLVRDAVKMCEPRIHRIGAELRLDLPEPDVRLVCYPVQIIQILINLLNNAVDSIGERRERWIRIALRADERGCRLTVTDSGPRISSTLAEKIFMPFFTTKKDQEGTGIGLSVSRSIARRHDGELALDMEAGNMCFVLTLPRKAAGSRDKAVLKTGPAQRAVA